MVLMTSNTLPLRHATSCAPVMIGPTKDSTATSSVMNPIVEAGNYQADSGYNLTLELLTRRHRPTAILCGNDRMALGSLMALRQKGVDVPAEMSLIGYDDHDALVTRVSPAITNVRLPFYEMGRWAAERMFEQGAQRLAPRTQMPCLPVLRESVSAPRS